VLYRLAEEGDASQNELGRKVGIDAATINGVIERLARKQLVKTRSDQVDRRRLRISLTPAGRRILHEAIPLARTITERTLSALSPDEAQLLTGLLHKMQRGVDGDDTADSA
jgi:DNA-binding MarR family transcriptional regulator